MDSLYYATPISTNFNGANGSQAFQNYGTSGPKSIVAAGGSPALSTAQSKFGGSSCKFNGTTDFLTFPQINLNSDFTIELWMYLTALPSSSAYASLVKSGVGAPGLVVHNGVVAWLDGSDRCVTAAVSVNTWYHIACCRLNGVINVYLNGVASTSYSAATTYPIYTVGGNTGEYMAGYIDDLRITNGVARYSANFTPPTTAMDTSGSLGINPKAVMSVLKASTSSPLPATSMRKPLSVLFAKDWNFGGKGIVSGTVKTKGTPDYPVSRKVRLFHETTGLLVKETWSDPVTGAYSFPYVRTDYIYTVVSYDHTGVNRAVIANGLKPDVMP